MNVSFKTIRRSGDKVYILSEISGYDERLPVVLAASTESRASRRIPFPIATWPTLWLCVRFFLTVR